MHVYTMTFFFAQHRVVTDTKGIKYDVTEINEEGKEVSVIRKNGVVLEEQIVHQDKVIKFKCGHF